MGLTQQEHDWLASLITVFGLGTAGPDPAKWPNYLGWTQYVTGKLADIEGKPAGVGLTPDQAQQLKEAHDIIVKDLK